ncbi:hypothetical protein GCM10027290_13470 [Micromonospora sonneratiae]
MVAVTSETPEPETTASESSVPAHEAAEIVEAAGPDSETSASETEPAKSKSKAKSRSKAKTESDSEPEPEPEPESGVAEPDAPTTLSITTPPTATKVRLDTPGVTVEIEAHESLETVVTTAMRLFHEAGGWPREIRQSAGFAQVERRDSAPVQPSSMPYAPGPYPVQFP